MTVNNVKELKKLLQLCREQGVKTFEVDGIKFELNDHTPSRRSQPRYKQISEPSYSLSPNIDETIAIPQMEPIDTDEISPEDMLMWSANGSEPTA